MKKSARVATEWSWHRPIFPGLDDPSIVGAGAFHCRVRHGNGWAHSALATRTNRSPRERFRATEEVEQTEGVGSLRERQSCRLDNPRDRGASPRPLVTLSSTHYCASTCVLSTCWSSRGLTRLTRWGISSSGELRT